MTKIGAMLAGALALLATTAGTAAAQNHELAGGFTCQRWKAGGVCGSKGFAIDFGVAVRTTTSRATSIIVDFGRTRFPDEETDMSILGGVRERFLRDRPISFFAEGLGGLVHWSQTFPFDDSGTDLVFGGGGGVHIRLTPKLDAKAQVDVLADRDQGDWSMITRIYVGVVFKMNKK